MYASVCVRCWVVCVDVGGVVVVYVYGAVYVDVADVVYVAFCVDSVTADGGDCVAYVIICDVIRVSGDVERDWYVGGEYADDADDVVGGDGVTAVYYGCRSCCVVRGVYADVDVGVLYVDVVVGVDVGVCGYDIVMCVDDGDVVVISMCVCVVDGDVDIDDVVGVVAGVADIVIAIVTYANDHASNSCGDGDVDEYDGDECTVIAVDVVYVVVSVM